MIKKCIAVALLISVFATSCSSDDDNNPLPIILPTTSNLVLSFDNLENLGQDYVYEGWIMVGGTPVTTGTFSVNDAGVLSQSTFAINATQLASATAFVLSIEPANDLDPAPSNTKVVSGAFNGNAAAVNSDAMVGDFSNAAGTYILATPTDMDATNEFSGVWFLDNSSGAPARGLDLPELADGWAYEGWVVMNGTPVSTGVFMDPAMADNNASTSPYKGASGNGPAYPGEDFVMGEAAGVMFPTDLKGTTIVVSVEPYPDNSAAPYTLKPLAHMVPNTAMDHTAIMMGDGPVSQITGMVTR